MFSATNPALTVTCWYEQDNDLSEFDESRDIIESLVDEYKACESPDYIKWGMEVYKLFPSIILLMDELEMITVSVSVSGPWTAYDWWRQCFRSCWSEVGVL